MGIAEFLADQAITFPKTSSGPRKVKFNSSTKWFTFDQYDDRVYRDICSLDNLERYQLQDFAGLNREEKVKVMQKHLGELWNTEFSKDEITLPEMADIDHSDQFDPAYVYHYYQPCLLKTQADNRYNFKYFDTYREELVGVSKLAVETILSRVIPRNQIDEWLNSKELRVIDLVYRPKSPALIDTKAPDGQKVTLLNTYKKPDWVSHKAKPIFSEIFEEFLDHLFPKSECRRYVLDWIHHSLNSRAQTYLYLCGGQGSGKNTLAVLLSKLHGNTNYSTPKSLRSNFNYYLKEKTFVFWDELTCKTQEQKNVLKSIINNEIQVEGKFRDHEQIDLCASYMIANNSLHALQLEPIDRRFSVPDITDSNMEYALGAEFIDDLLAEINHPEAIAEFGKWITQSYMPVTGPLDAHQDTDRFEEIVIATARAGFSFTLDKIFRKDALAYCYEEEKEEFEADRRRSIKYPAKPDFENFFRNVKQGGKNLIAKVSDDGQKIWPRKEFQGKGGLSIVDLV